MVTNAGIFKNMTNQLSKKASSLLFLPNAMPIAHPKNMAMEKLVSRRNKVTPIWWGNCPDLISCHKTWSTKAGVGKVLLSITIANPYHSAINKTNDNNDRVLLDIASNLRDIVFNPSSKMCPVVVSLNYLLIYCC